MRKRIVPTTVTRQIVGTDDVFRVGEVVDAIYSGMIPISRVPVTEAALRAQVLEVLKSVVAKLEKASR